MDKIESEFFILFKMDTPLKTNVFFMKRLVKISTSG